MAAKKNWGDLSARTRKMIITGAIAEGMLKVAALVDIKRRPASQIRGPKWVWATALTVVGSAGILPVTYFLCGRRQAQSRPG